MNDHVAARCTPRHPLEVVDARRRNHAGNAPEPRVHLPKCTLSQAGRRQPSRSSACTCVREHAKCARTDKGCLRVSAFEHVKPWVRMPCIAAGWAAHLAAADGRLIQERRSTANGRQLAARQRVGARACKAARYLGAVMRLSADNRTRGRGRRVGRADVREADRLAVQCRRGLEYCFLLYHLLDADRYNKRRRQLSYVFIAVRYRRSFFSAAPGRACAGGFHCLLSFHAPVGAPGCSGSH